MWKRAFAAASIGVALLASACAGGSKGPVTPTTSNPLPSAAFAFTASPIPVNDIQFIVPLGNLNPPGHTLPTDHIYFYFADPGTGESPVARRTDFFAPADGTVMAVIDNGVGADRKVLFQATTRVQYYVDHLIPSIPLPQGTRVRAGDRLGTTGGSFGIDLGVTNQDVTLTGLLNLSRYAPGEEHTDAPLRHYQEPLRAQLYSRVRSRGPSLDGKFDHDVAGRLSGNWFGESDQAPMTFAYDTFDQTAVRIAVSSGLALAPGVFGIAPGDPLPRDVSSATGIVRYTLTGPGGGTVGYLLAQLLDDRRIRVEIVVPPSAPADSFSANAKSFTR